MATSTLFNTDFFNQLFKQTLDQVTVWAMEITKSTIGRIWLLINPYWPYIAISLFVLLIFLVSPILTLSPSLTIIPSGTWALIFE